jgi:hypothetical protein
MVIEHRSFDCMRRRHWDISESPDPRSLHYYLVFEGGDPFRRLQRHRFATDVNAGWIALSVTVTLPLAWEYRLREVLHAEAVLYLARSIGGGARPSVSRTLRLLGFSV